MIKLIASDIDGTLVKDGTLAIDREYMEVIGRLIDKGIVFVACSDGSSKDRNFFKRSDEDVFKRYLYGCRKPCRSSGTHSPVQHERKGTTDRCPASR